MTKEEREELPNRTFSVYDPYGDLRKILDEEAARTGLRRSDVVRRLIQAIERAKK